MSSGVGFGGWGSHSLLFASCMLGQKPGGLQVPQSQTLVCDLPGLLRAPALSQPEAREQGVGQTGFLVAFPNVTITQGPVRAGLLSRPAPTLPPPGPHPTYRLLCTWRLRAQGSAWR